MELPERIADRPHATFFILPTEPQRLYVVISRVYDANLTARGFDWSEEIDPDMNFFWSGIDSPRPAYYRHPAYGIIYAGDYMAGRHMNIDDWTYWNAIPRSYDNEVEVWLDGTDWSTITEARVLVWPRDFFR